MEWKGVDVLAFCVLRWTAAGREVYHRREEQKQLDKQDTGDVGISCFIKAGV